MAALDPTQYMHFVEDPAMVNGTGKLVIDASSEFETFHMIPPTTAPGAPAAGEPANYNGVSVEFNVDIDPGVRVRFDKSYLKIDYRALDVTNPLVPIAINPVNVSIPWNTVSAIFSDAQYGLNSESRVVEKYDGQVGHSNMISMLTSYSRDALEEASDRLFTPCMESTRDTTVALSAEAQARAALWLGVGGVAISGSKTIMLGDLFDSMKIPAAWRINKFQPRIVIKNSNNILIMNGAGIALSKFFVTGIRLYLCYNKLSAKQIEADTAKLTSGEPIMLNSFRRFDAVNPTGNVGSLVMDFPSVRNMQAAVVMISSTQAADGIGSNPYQYCYGEGLLPGTGVSSYQQRYGMTYSPMDPVGVSQANKVMNTDIMENWRVLNRTINDRNFVSPINFRTHIGTLSAAADISSYVLFASSFVNQEAAPKKQMAGVTHYVNIQGSATTAYVIVRIRMVMLAIQSNLAVELLE